MSCYGKDTFLNSIETCASIEEVRTNIDRIDRIIVEMLAERGGYVKQAAQFKKSVDDVKAPQRVEQVISKVKALSLELGADPSVAEQVYRAMIAGFIKAELKEHAELNSKASAPIINQTDYEMQYYPDDKLFLKEDVSGARQWAVFLDKTMLTYFEVDPDCRFESHSHESEQITMVLEGVLYFEQGEEVIGVKAGEVIAIPAHAPHAVFTGESAVKAVDAWSPVMTKYKQENK